MKKVIIIGSAHPLRGGGITTFNQRLAREFLSQGYDCSIVSFSLQYPSLLFPGTNQYTTDPPPEGIKIFSLINSINPLNWFRVGKQIKNWNPDIIVVRYWMSFMGPALGTILRQIKKNNHSKVICIADNIIPHEKKFFDTPFTRYFLKACDAFVTMSEKVLGDLKKLEKQKPVRLVSHPLYDNFGKPVEKNDARDYLRLSKDDKIILFFGFILLFSWLGFGSKKRPVAANPVITVTDTVDFVKQVQPILVKNCSPCHFTGGKMYERMPFDKDTTIINHEKGILKRIKGDENVLLKTFIEQNKNN